MFVYEVVPYLSAGLAATWMFRCKKVSCDVWDIAWSLGVFGLMGILLPVACIALTSCLSQPPPQLRRSTSVLLDMLRQ